jgi:Leucine-rich repeat (LRR) protein
MEITFTEFIGNKNLDKSKIISLNCHNNQLTKLSDLSSLVNLKHLHCSHNQLTELPDLSSLVNLTHFYCSHNKLTKLPNLSSLVNLTHLYCSYNQLIELPDLSSLVNLGYLYCLNNQLTKLPDLSSFVNLNELFCSNNQLTELPDLSSLVNLEQLNCYNNKLVKLPDLSSLVNLTHLYCSYNQLTELPDLSSLDNLTHLYCSNNQLKTIPQSIISCRYLVIFRYNDNPIDYIPPNVQRFIRRMRNIQTVGNIYNDSQSVHRSSVTNSVKKSIEHLMDYKTDLKKEKMVTIILENQILSENVKSRIIQYIEDKEELIHSMVTFEDLLIKVASRIISYSDPNELFRILNDQMIESECMCLTGRMSRLISVLDGFFDDIRISIESSEMISSIILQITSIPGTVEEHKQLATQKLLESGYSLEEIESSIEAIE